MKEEEKSTNPTPLQKEQAEVPLRDAKLNAFTIVMVLAFLLVLLAQTVGAGMLRVPENEGLAKPNEFTKAWEECKEIGKSDAACYKTATAVGRKSPTPKLCDPYKPARPVVAGETFDQFVQYYDMNAEQIAQFIKINGLSPAYPNTVIYTGMVYCLPYGVDKKKAEGAYATDTGVTGFDPNKDFFFTLADIHWNEISFDLFNFPPNDKVTVWYWNKPPFVSRWKCVKSVDDTCIETSYDDKENWSGPSGPGFSNENNRRIYLGQFKVTKKRVTLVFPEEVGGWNGLYVCMHSLKRDEMDQDKDRPASYHPSYHSYCQYISMSRPQTTAIVRPIPTDKNPPTRFPLNTPCLLFFNPFWNGSNNVVVDRGWVISGNTCYNNFLNNCGAYTDQTSCNTRSECTWTGALCQSQCNGRATATCEVITVSGVSICRWSGGACTIRQSDPRINSICMPECPGTRIPTPTNTPCGNYGPCPGTRVPFVTPNSLSQCLNYPSYGYHIENIPTPTAVPACSVWWKTPVSKR